MSDDSDITQQIQGLLDQQLGQWPELFEAVVFDGAVARAKESYPLGLLPHTEPQFIDHHLEAVDRLFSEISQIDAVETERLINVELSIGDGLVLQAIYLQRSQLVVTTVWKTPDRALQWSLLWRAFDAGLAASRAAHGSQQNELGLLLAGRVLSAKHYSAACQGWLVDLNSVVDAQRSLLFLQSSGQLVLEQVSGIGHFEGKRHLLSLATDAAEEAFDQQLAVVEGDNRDNGIVRLAQQAFSREFAPLTISSMPLFADQFSTQSEEPSYRLQEPLGAVVFLHEQPLDEQKTIELEQVLSLSIPALLARKKLARPFVVGLKDDLAATLAALLGSGFLKAKLALIGLIIFLLVSSLWQVDEQLSAGAELFPQRQQRVSALMDGYLRNASVKEGDRVVAGQLLAELDSRDLVLERLQRLSRYSRLESEYLQAVAQGLQGDMAVVKARLNEAGAELELVDQQLQRLKVLAPVDALVISGDLSQRLGDPVRSGDLLFVLATLDDFEIQIKIPEYRLSDVKVGDRGQLFLNARTEVTYEFEVTGIKPHLVAEQGGSFLLAEAMLRGAGADDRFQPGMVGIARLDVGRASALTSWTRQLTYVVERWLWRWFGI